MTALHKAVFWHHVTWVISDFDAVITGGRYLNSGNSINFPNISRDYLEYNKLKPIESKQFSKHDNVFNAIAEKDILLYYPYH
jgi:polyphosphate kinase